MIALALLLFACNREDPGLVATRDALAAWERGVEHLDAGEAALARADFASARQLRPQDPLLAIWEAKAAAESGDLDGAIDALDVVLAQSPDIAVARYNRAAYKARRGDPVEEIAPELVRAVDDGACRARDILDDPDFQAIVDDPIFDDFLPESPLTIGVEAPQGTMFWGSEFQVRLRIAGAGDDPISVTAEEVIGPLALVSVTDDQNPSTEGIFRDLSWTFRVVGAGPVQLGPFHAWVSEKRTVVPAVSFETAAPEGKEAPPPGLRAISFSTPSEVRGRGALPSARMVEDDLIVVYTPGDRVVITPMPTTEPVRYEHRVRSRTQWVLDRYPDVPEGAEISVSRGGQALFNTVAERSAG